MELRIGQTFPDHVALVGHSDGDVAAHALADALLGAADLGDLGTNFGVDRPEYQGVSGQVLLAEVRGMLDGAGWQLVNATVQVIGQTPRLAPHYHQAAQALSEVVGGPVSFGATTTDRMGFTGAKEGLAASACCLLQR